MSGNSVSNIGLSAGGYTYLNKAGEDIKKNYRNEAVWHVLERYNTNKNDKLEVSEISAFQQDIKRAAGDNVMDRRELDNFARQLGVSSRDLNQCIQVVNSEIIANELMSSMHTLFSSFDKAKCSKFLNQINASNVSEIWDQYQSNVDNRFSVRGFLLQDNSLASDILKNYDQKEAFALLDKIYNAMVKDCQNKKIDITTLKEKYTSARKSENKENIDIALREIGMRLNYHKRITDIAHTNSRQIGGLGNGTMNNSDKIQTSQIAENKNVKLTNDVVGDGVLGNTESVAVGENAGAVYNAVKELLNDKSMNETIRSCFVKDSEFMVVYFPARNTHYSSNEHGLINGKIIEKSVIGDGDMSVLVGGILKQMEEVGFKKFNDKSAVKEFITNLFSRNLTGHNRLKPTM